MMKGLKLLLIGTIAFSTVAPALAKQEEPGKVRAFWQKHKGKIAAGVALAAMIGTAITLYSHSKKVNTALTRAKIEPKYEHYAAAVVGLLGFLGEDRIIKLLTWATKTNVPGLVPEEKIVTMEEFGFLIVTDMNDALAFYLYPEKSMQRRQFKLRFKAIVAKKFISDAKEKLEDAAENIGKAAAKLKKHAGDFLK